MMKLQRVAYFIILCIFSYVFIFSTKSGKPIEKSDCVKDVMLEAKKCERAVLRLHEDFSEGCPPREICDNCTQIHSADMERVSGDKLSLADSLQVITTGYRSNTFRQPLTKSLHSKQNYKDYEEIARILTVKLASVSRKIAIAIQDGMEKAAIKKLLCVMMLQLPQTEDA